MKINYENANLLNTKISFHDKCIKKLIFDSDKRELCLVIVDSLLYEDLEEYTIRFINVVGFWKTACDFWGPSPHIMGVSYLHLEEQELLPHLYQLYKTQKTYPDLISNLDTDAKFLEILIESISGDIMRIACESIIIDDNPTE